VPRCLVPISLSPGFHYATFEQPPPFSFIFLRNWLILYICSQKWKDLLALDTSMGYQGHEEAMRRGSSFTNSHKLTV